MCRHRPDGRCDSEHARRWLQCPRVRLQEHRQVQFRHTFDAVGSGLPPGADLRHRPRTDCLFSYRRVWRSGVRGLLPRGGIPSDTPRIRGQLGVRVRSGIGSGAHRPSTRLPCSTPNWPCDTPTPRSNSNRTIAQASREDPQSQCSICMRCCGLAILECVVISTCDFPG